MPDTCVSSCEDVLASIERANLKGLNEQAFSVIVLQTETWFLCAAKLSRSSGYNFKRSGFYVIQHRY